MSLVFADLDEAFEGFVVAVYDQGGLIEVPTEWLSSSDDAACSASGMEQ